MLSKAGFGLLVNEAELRESYELCQREGQRLLGSIWAATDLLPEPIRPPMYALAAFGKWTDHIADEGEPSDRERALARWCGDTLAEVRAGHSEHPLRRAFVHTMCRWELDVEVLEEFLQATRADGAAAPALATVADQRRYLRGIAGTVAELVTPLLEPREPEGDAARLMSLLGEVCQLVDIFQDFPLDLARDRCYLPSEDLRRLGLDVGDLWRGERRDALDELIEIQLARARDLLERATPVVETMPASSQPFVYGLVLGAEVQFEEVGHLRSRVLLEGVRSPVLSGPRPCSDTQAPGHVAVIMDGNRRWAAARGLLAEEGHRAGVRAAMRLVVSALRQGIRHLSVFAFSTENWTRSEEEMASLFQSMAAAIRRGAEWLHERGVRVRWCGRRDRLDETIGAAMTVVESMTSNNTVLSLSIFADYGGRDEMVAAARALAAEAVAGTIRPEEIGPADISRHLYAPDLPEVDLLIRTSGEQRISNFLPWHLAYAEFVFDPVHWPDFGYQHLLAAVTEYSGRQRRFGSDSPAPQRLPEPTGAG